MKSIGVIGFGNMGGAFAVGLKQKGFHVTVTDASEERAFAARENYGLDTTTSLAELFDRSEIVMIGVKPQDWAGLAGKIGSLAEGGRIISIMAGVPTALIHDRLRCGECARFMPNLAASEGKALVGVTFHGEPAPEFRAACLSVAGAVGTPLEVPEKLIPAVTGISGSGIAYVFAFLHAMALGGVASGLGYETALQAALGAAEGAVSVLKATGENPIVWLSRVASPAGTTIEGIKALEESGFTIGVIRAVEEAAQRAREIEDSV